MVGNHLGPALDGIPILAMGHWSTGIFQVFRTLVAVCHSCLENGGVQLLVSNAQCAH
jgi:hypothetical protein